MNCDICYVVSHGFAARMIIQTNLLGRLVAQGKKVALIAPDEKDENMRAYCEKHGITLKEFSPESAFWNSNYANSRMYFMENIYKNPALYEKYIYSTKYQNNINIKRLWRARILKVVHDVKEKIPAIKKWYINREQNFLDSDSAKALIKELNPKNVVSTYPVNFSEAMLLRAAKDLKKNTTIHLLSWDNITCKGRFPFFADKYIVWGKIMHDELVEFYNVDPKDISVTGVAHFDLHCASRQSEKVDGYFLDLELDPDKPYVFFGMSSPRFAPGEIDILEWLCKKIQENAFGKDLQFIIRPHPQNMQGTMMDGSWIPRLEKLKSDRISIDFPKLSKSKMPWSMRESDMIRLSHLIAHAELSFNSGSTLTIDSFMAGTPVILTSFDGVKNWEYWQSAERLVDYTHLKKLIALGDVDVAKNYDDLKRLIIENLNNNKKLSEIGFNTIKNMTFSADGNATTRVVDTLLKNL